MSSVVEELETIRRERAELLLALAAALEKNEKIEQGYAALERENSLLRAALKAARNRIFGPRSEKLDAIQHGLFEEASTEIEGQAREELAETAAAQTEEAERQAAERTKRRVRRRLCTQNLPRERKVHEASEAERTPSRLPP